MNIDNLANSFKYNSLLKFKDLKKYQQNFNKSKLDINLYSIWDFSEIITNKNSLKNGLYIYLGNKNKNTLIFLTYQMMPVLADLKELSIKDFILFKNTNLIRLFNFPVEQEEVIFNYIFSYFSIQKQLD